MNPTITLDLTKHPMYSTVDYYRDFCKVFKAEVLMFNSNKGSMRVRLLNEDGTVFTGNFDTDVRYMVEDSITFSVR